MTPSQNFFAFLGICNFPKLFNVFQARKKSSVSKGVRSLGKWLDGSFPYWLSIARERDQNEIPSFFHNLGCNSIKIIGNHFNIKSVSNYLHKYLEVWNNKSARKSTYYDMIYSLCSYWRTKTMSMSFFAVLQLQKYKRVLTFAFQFIWYKHYIT